MIYSTLRWHIILSTSAYSYNPITGVSHPECILCESKYSLIYALMITTIRKSGFRSHTVSRSHDSQTALRCPIMQLAPAFLPSPPHTLSLSSCISLEIGAAVSCYLAVLSTFRRSSKRADHVPEVTVRVRDGYSFRLPFEHRHYSVWIVSHMLF